MNIKSEVLQFHLPCQDAMISVNTTENKWPETKAFADGCAFCCSSGDQKYCPLFRISRLKEYQDFQKLLSLSPDSEIATR